MIERVCQMLNGTSSQGAEIESEIFNTGEGVTKHVINISCLIKSTTTNNRRPREI